MKLKKLGAFAATGACARPRTDGLRLVQRHLWFRCRFQQL